MRQCCTKAETRVPCAPLLQWRSRLQVFTTLRWARPWPVSQSHNMCSTCDGFMKPCNSPCFAQLAAFFIDLRAEWSTVQRFFFSNTHWLSSCHYSRSQWLFFAPNKRVERLGVEPRISRAIPFHIHTTGTIIEKELNRLSFISSLFANPSGKHTGLHQVWRLPLKQGSQRLAFLLSYTMINCTSTTFLPHTSSIQFLNGFSL